MCNIRRKTLQDQILNTYAQHDEMNENMKHYSDNFYELMDLQVISNTMFPSASVKIKKGEHIFNSSNTGSGPIDALYSAIKDIIDIDITLLEYKISSVSRGKEALGKVKLQVEYQGETYISKATDTDVIKASALAYINAVNSIIVANLLPV